jgi:hypothetical protein
MRLSGSKLTRAKHRTRPSKKPRVVVTDVAVDA